MRLILTIAILLCGVLANAQSNITGRVLALPDSIGVADCNITLVRQDSIYYETTTSANGTFTMSNVVHDTYAIEADGLGYDTYRGEITVNGPTSTNIVLTPLSRVYLNEVVVTGNRSETVTRTADGQIFYLSKEAKSHRNPFMALQEIPILISDPSMASVTTLDGKQPLILIDGNRVNSGIAPIDANDIESVEVITNPSARYLKDGYKSVINITLKRKNVIYQWYEFATRHDIPLDNGLAVGYFEVGNPKYSVYGRLNYNYTYNDDTESNVMRSDLGYQQIYSQHNRNNGYNWLGDLLFKANPNKSNYFALHFYGKTQTQKNALNGDGILINAPQQTPQSYSFHSNDRDESVIFTSSAYFKHSFSKNNIFEARLAYNYNKNDFSNTRTDEYSLPEEYSNVYDLLFHNRRHSGSLQMDYENSYSDINSVFAGSHTTFQSDRIENVTQPAYLFRHRQLSQYVYGGWTSQFWDKVWFSSSIGIEGIWLKADKYNNDYIKPRASIGLTWMINNNNSLTLNYRLTNDAPSVGELNPINTSTDDREMTVGNPYLMPQTNHSIPLSYTFNYKRLYIDATLQYRRVNDLVTSTGYTNPDGVFVSTYANLGHYSALSAYLNISYRIKHGRLFTYGGCSSQYFPCVSRHFHYFVSGGYMYSLGKFLFVGTVTYQNKNILDEISWLKYYKPTEADIQVNYRFTPDFYVGVCLKHFTGKYHTRLYTGSGTYNQTIDNYYSDKNLRPWILVRYTFRRNQEQKIKLEQVLRSLEDGISIKR